VSDAVRSGWISSAGSYLDRFESDWAAYCGRKHGIAVSNGTTALHIAVAALDLQPGDEVIMPSFTIISCALAVVYAGGTPVLVDADPCTWTMSIDEVARKIGPRTRAIMPVHIYGHPCDMDPLLALAVDRNIVVLEDAAEAHGAEYLTGRDSPVGAWRRCGSFGALSCFSFYANKLITTGEGGMVLTDDARLAEQARSLRNLCFQPQRRFFHEQLGFNYRLTNLQAALGVAQIERIDAIVARKRWIGTEYTSRLRGTAGLQLPIEMPWAKNVYWMYGLTLADDARIDAAELGNRMRARDIETRPFFLGMHEQPALLERGLFAGERYPVTDRLARRGLYLPSGLTLTEEQIDRVCGTLKDALA
jgi:perosamine synthetase